MSWRGWQNKLILVFTVGLALATSQTMGQFLVQGDISKSDLIDNSRSSEIDWNREYYYAKGEGIIPSSDEEPNRAKALLKAKGFGKMKAIANLLMAIEGTAISYKASGKDYMLKDETLQQTIEGYVNNVEIVSEKQQIESGETMVVVTVRAPMYGSEGPGTAILKSKQKLDKSPENGGVNIDRRSDPKLSTMSQDNNGPFTSVVIDCSGLGVERAMSPKIRRQDGSEVWGTVSVDYDFLEDHGIVAYTRTIDQAAQNSRSGKNPLMLKAIGRAGDKFMCDPVISDTDADRLIRENQSTGFLDKFNVVFVVGN